MATVMVMHWPEVTPEQYQAARELVGWEREPAKGGQIHVAWFGDDGFRVIDVWDSPADFQNFVETRLRPGVEQLGIKGEPKVQFHEAAGVFVPGR